MELNRVRKKNMCSKISKNISNRFVEFLKIEQKNTSFFFFNQKCSDFSLKKTTKNIERREIQKNDENVLKIASPNEMEFVESFFTTEHFPII